MLIETHPDYIVLRSDKAVFRRENGSEAEMKIEVRVDGIRSFTIEGGEYTLKHVNGTVCWMNKPGDTRDIILQLGI